MINSVRRIIYSGFFPKAIIGGWQKIKNYFSFMFAKSRFSRADKLHLACGNNIFDGWGNVDLYGPKEVIRWDLRFTLPINNLKIKYVYAEHFIEHISRDDAKKLLSDMFRILCPTGVLRLTTPSLQRVVTKYLQEDFSEWNDVKWYPSSPCDMMNGFFRNWGHVYVYDLSELFALLRVIRFIK